MKQRILSSAAGLVILFTVFAFFDTILLNMAVSAIVGMAVSELLIASDIKKFRVLYVSGIAFGACVPLLGVFLFNRLFYVLSFVFVIVLIGFLLWYRGDGFEQITLVFFFSLFISLTLNLFILGRDTYGAITGIYLVLVAFVAAWMNDTGAYFFGIRFGKHKLAPSVSPKKTIEGAGGGGFVALISQIIAAVVFMQVFRLFGTEIKVYFESVLLISPLLSLMGILGDLLASQIKRQYHIKDFGNIMPGHGGVLDRFDSVFLVVPPVYLLFSAIRIVEVL
jgi:phosphatidate cytidylyltransferase